MDERLKEFIDKNIPASRQELEIAEAEKLSPARAAERLKALMKIKEGFEKWNSGHEQKT